MNLVNTEATPIHRVLALVREEAARRGAMISGCEVVGLIPSYAMFDAAEHTLQLENFRRDQVLELRLKQPPLTEAVTLNAVLEQVAGPTPTPGGGTVAAIAGALAGALATMVANLTIGKKKYASAEAEMRTIKERAEGLRRELMSLARADSEAFEGVLRAGRLPQGTPEQAEIRETAIAKANLDAARVPLRTAEACLEVLGLAERAARSGNPNAVTDAGVSGLLARAAGEGALLNVEINLKSAPATADKEDVETGLHRLRAAFDAAARDHQTAVRSVLDES
jgi:glutamate formiminotransferase/formiminotetrahydrofolate cyclodeaminase